MSEMVDRIAGAILDAKDKSLDETAKDVLRAMREPTKKMRNAGIRELGIDADETTVWQAMIDAALA